MEELDQSCCKETSTDALASKLAPLASLSGLFYDLRSVQLRFKRAGGGGSGEKASCSFRFGFLDLLVLLYARTNSIRVLCVSPKSRGSCPRSAIANGASTNSAAVLATALEIILHDKAACCGKDSALEDAVLSDPSSLAELSTKLQGRHLLSDGRPIVVNAEYVPQSSISPYAMISALLGQHASLIEWKSHVYVLYGATFDETLYSSGQRQFVVHKLLLLDPRFSDQRRETEFNRETDDFGKVHGLLTLAVVRQ